MKTMRTIIILLAAIAMITGTTIQAQILKDATRTVRDAGSTVTDPIKDARSTVKKGTEPIRDVRRAGQDVTQPVRDVKRETDGLKTDIERAKNDAEQLKNDVRGNRSRKNKDDDATDPQGGMTDAERAHADSVYKSRQRTGSVRVRSNTSTAAAAGGREEQGQGQVRQIEPTEEDDTETSGQVVLLPPNRIKQRPRQQEYGTTIGESRPAALRPGYANSPARDAIDRVEFDIETLDELFEAAIWTGPDSAHTARSIAYMLKELRDDITEVRRRDRNWDTGMYESRYRKWKGLYRANTDPDYDI